QCGFGGLIDKDAETLVGAGDGADQRKLWPLDLGRLRPRRLRNRHGRRRDGEKIGRSRVVVSVASGIAHKGLALLARSGSAGFAGAVTLTTTGAGAAGRFHSDGVAGVSTRCCGAASRSVASVGTAAVEPGTARAATSSEAAVIARQCVMLRSLICHPSTAPTRSRARAACRPSRR